MNHPNIRAAVPDDAETIFQFICELADFVKERDQLESTAEAIRNTVFGENAVCEALIYEEDGKPLGFALWFYTYSTWQARPGLYLQDIYVSANARGKGVGGAILKYLAKLAVEKDCGRFEWAVLEWNKKAIEVYDSMGAKPGEGYLHYRLAGQDLLDYANR